MARASAPSSCQRSRLQVFKCQPATVQANKLIKSLISEGHQAGRFSQQAAFQLRIRTHHGEDDIRLAARGLRHQTLDPFAVATNESEICGRYLTTIPLFAARDLVDSRSLQRRQEVWFSSTLINQSFCTTISVPQEVVASQNLAASRMDVSIRFLPITGHWPHQVIWQ